LISGDAGFWMATGNSGLSIQERKKERILEHKLSFLNPLL